MKKIFLTLILFFLINTFCFALNLSNNKVTIDNDGKVGIGISTPSAKLEVDIITSSPTVIFGDYENGNYIEISSSNHRLIMHGTSRVRNILQFSAGVLKAPGVNPASFENLGLGGIYKFAKGNDEVIIGDIAILPEIDISTTICIRVGIASPDTTGDAIFKLEYLYRAIDEDISSSTPDDTLYSTTTVSSTSYGYKYATFNLQAPTISDKYFSYRLTRIASIDTVTNEVYVKGLSLIYYSNKLGE